MISIGYANRAVQITCSMLVKLQAQKRTQALKRVRLASTYNQRALPPEALPKVPAFRIIARYCDVLSIKANCSSHGLKTQQSTLIALELKD
eukprot:5925172-Pleurochrysis_carterae.AAC.2